MKRTISSSQTFLAKFVVPIFFILVIGIEPFSEILRSRSSATSLDLALILILILGIAFTFWLSVRMKKVSVDGRNLYISNYFKEISVPLAEIYDVTELVWVNAHPVTIHLRKPTEFGSNIMFMPKIRLFAFFSSHPIVSELKALSNHNTSF